MLSVIHADYLVVGAGLAGLAFTDALIDGSDASVVIVDRNHAPGGHWVHCYPFVRLHQPSLLYGVQSVRLGQDRIRTQGTDKGEYERATGSEICGYFDQVMHSRLLASGQVQYFPNSNYLGDGCFESLISGKITEVQVRRRIVDATYGDTNVPASTPPAFDVATDAVCLPPGDLVRLAERPEGYVVLGAGKTSMDTCQYLLERGLDPERIIWVRPRDPWLLNRVNYQGGEFALDAFEGVVQQLEAGVAADTVDDYFDALDTSHGMLRIDPAVRPTMVRGATSHTAEIELLRQVENVVRLGHVERAERDRIVLRGGDYPVPPGYVYVHCTADGLPTKPPVEIFAPGRITTQPVRAGSPSFSFSLTGMLEATERDDKERNRLAVPNAFFNTPLDWVRASLRTLQMESGWGRESDVAAWMAGTNLNLLRRLPEQADTEAGQRMMRRFGQSVGPGMQGMLSLMEEATEDERLRDWPQHA